jgi:HEAT repeat protein
MLLTSRLTRKPSPFILYALAFILSFLLTLPWVNAEEKPKPPEAWQINGVVAALDDGHDKVKGYALKQLAEYELKNLKTVFKKPEDIAEKAAKILKDKSVDSNVRFRAALALGKLGELAKPYIKDIANIFKDKTVDEYVRGGAALALGKLGELAKPYVKDILEFLKDKTVDEYVRGDVAEVLGNLGKVGKPYVKDIADVLKDKTVDARVRGGAVEALGNLGEIAKPYVKDIADVLKDKTVGARVRGLATLALEKLGQTTKPSFKDILDFIKDQSVSIRYSQLATYVLGNLQETAKFYVKNIADILKDKTVDSDVRGRAAYVLGNLGDTAKPYVNDILKFLKDETVDKYVRQNVALVLGNLRETAKPYVKDILDLLKDQTVYTNVRENTALILGNFGEATKPYLKDILEFLKDKTVDASVRSRAAYALGNLGDTAKPYIKDIADIIKDKSVDADVRGSAAEALGNFGEATKPYVKDILEFLKDQTVDASVRRSVAEALKKVKQLKLEEVVVILNYVYEPNQGDFNFISKDIFFILNEGNFEQWRFLTYFLGGGTDDVKILLQWLGQPKAITREIKYEVGKKTLQLFHDAWKQSHGLDKLRSDLAKQIAVVAKQVSWKPQDINLLQRHCDNLKQGGHSEADTVQSAINNVEFWQWFVRARITILTHAAFWLALIFAYPKFPQIQAIFFWNPWVRRILGVGYVGFLLTWVPFFRRKLFEPFKPSLLADAGLDNFHDQSYFPQSQVKVPGSGDIFPVTVALPKIHGQIILEGDSGLGKSMFLRHLLTNSQRIVVYLPAQKCHKGVIEAIQDKLHGQAQDADFLKNLIYSGAIDICIDGLNEVTADTRAKICQFVESYFRGNIIMTTQPLEWTPPSTAKTYYLQPLEQTQIQEFLLSRQPRLPKDALVQGQDYEKACIDYLQEVLTTQQPEEELNAARRILSNPMDLTVVALMLSQGKHPNLFRLQEQQYNLMAAEYLKEWNQEFPLKKFAAAVYQMRLQDQQALPADEFYQVVMSLEDEKYKMVVSRQWQDDKGEAKKEWYFRHDKIMDFFLVQNFLGNSDEADALLVDRMGDPRFRGVYFLLATLLPLDAAKELREKLIQYAADTKDNTVSNTFVQLLRTR